MHVLDNAIWQALTTRQESLAEVCGPARRFQPDVSLMAGFAEPSREAFDSLARLLDGSTAGLIMAQPADPPPGWSVVRSIPLVQMTREDTSSLASPHEFSELVTADIPEMLALTELTKPGPFGRRTYEMGTYLGIRRNGRLAAMAGERLKLPGYTEVSAVCTHPDHTGKGYAASLMAEIIRRIQTRNEIPFLHARPEYTRAVDLYRRLGFRELQIVHYTLLSKAA